jgi:hypothetical protein
MRHARKRSSRSSGLLHGALGCACASALLLAVGSAAATPATPRGGSALTVYDSLADFQAATQGYAAQHEEHFEGGFAQFLPFDQFGEFASCVEPVDASSNDACFKPGDLVDGIHITSSSNYGVIVLNSQVFETADRVLAAWPYQSSAGSQDYTIVHFDQPPLAVAADVYGIKLAPGTPTGDSVPVEIDAHAADDSLIGSFTVQSDTWNVPVFAGFTSPVPVAWVEYGTHVDIAAAPIDNLYFAGAAAALTGSPLSYDFGAVPIGDEASTSVSFTNSGDLEVTLGTLPPLPAPYSLADDGCSGATLAPGSNCSMTVAFAPLYRSDFAATLSVAADPQHPAVIALAGAGVVAPSTRAVRAGVGP